jgi:Protein of unknown function (DUF3043)
VPSLFRRKPADLAADPAAEATPDEPQHRPKGYTPSKGKATPKRPSAQGSRELPPTDRKEAAKRARERQREARQEQRAGMMAGDERYLLPRDKGPERALARDVVDSRRTAGTWFFSAAFIVLIISSIRALPPAIALGANFAWLFLGFGVILDSYLITRKLGKLIRERFPRTQQRMGGLYGYAIMRALSYRRMRIPKPRVKIGDKV